MGPDASQPLTRAGAFASRVLRALAFRPYAATAALTLLCLALYVPGVATLPVTDRDEARFAQSSKQMIETGNYIDIRLQDVPRYKKPIGIYWLQSASAGIAQRFGAPGNAIWAYRIPSALSALGAVLMLFWLMRPVIGRQTAAVAAALFASSLTLTFEAHIAKSDAALVLSLVAMQCAMFRLYAAPPGAPAHWLAAVFWLALGAGILLKGPIAPALAALTAIPIAIWDERRGWLRHFHWQWGVPLMLAVTLPWFVAIGLASGGAFFKASLGQDFAAKLGSGQENHWAPPGFYFALMWWTFWPAAMGLTAGAAKLFWRGRHTRRGLFLAAWIVPFWLLIEAAPTKLPHYALPLYPALAIAGAFYLRQCASRGVVWSIVAAAQLLVLAAGLWVFDADVSPALAVLAACYVALCALAVAAMRAAHRELALIALVLAAVTFDAAAFRFALPAMRPVWISEEAASAIRLLSVCGTGPATFAGYSAPSAVFLNGTKTSLTDAAGAARQLAEGTASLAAVTWPRRTDFELRFAEAHGSAPLFLGCADGVDLNGRGPTRLQIYASPEARKRPACRRREELPCPEKNEVQWRRLLNSKF